MKIIPFAEVDPVDWNTVCDVSDAAWLYHRHQWVDIETAFFANQNLSFAVHDGRRVVGLLPLYFQEVGLTTFVERLMHSGLHRHTGLALRADLMPDALAAACTVAINHVKALAVALGCDRIQLNVQNAAPGNRRPGREEVPFWVREYGFHLGLYFCDGGFLPAPGLSTLCLDQIVDLRVPETELFSRLESGCRRAVRKGISQGLVLEPLTGEDAIDRYFALAQRSAVRTGEQLPDRTFYQAIARAFMPTSCIVFMATDQGCDAAGIVVLLDKGCANFMAGASDPERLARRPNDFVHYSAMLWLKARGVQVYRLGPVFPELPFEAPISRVSRFKGKFGAPGLPIIQGSCFLKPDRYLDMAIRHFTARVEPKRS